MPFEISPKFKRALRKKRPEFVAAILECIDRLDRDPTHPGLHTHRVQGTRGVWEAYVDDGNRVTFHYEEGRMVLRNHCHHDIVRTNP
ncbi:MAG: hypothetical protein ACRDZ3_22845 [Acidimicrobiia bacterium]